LVANLGITINDLGFYWDESTLAERTAVEGRLRAHLDAGFPCGLVNMEFQLITGYDDTGFLTTQPWPRKDFPPDHLTFGSWVELGKGIHISFMTFTRCAPAADVTAIASGLGYGADLWQHPERHSGGDYAVGAGAYRNWISALEKGTEGYDPHGNWWNATVWAECRQYAAAFLDEVAATYPVVASTAHALAADYRAISAALCQVGDKECSVENKIALLRAAAATEAACVAQLGALAALIEG
jgi:hypothetical protein